MIAVGVAVCVVGVVCSVLMGLGGVAELELFTGLSVSPFGLLTGFLQVMGAGFFSVVFGRGRICGVALLVTSVASRSVVVAAFLFGTV